MVATLFLAMIPTLGFQQTRAEKLMLMADSPDYIDTGYPKRVQTENHRTLSVSGAGFRQGFSASGNATFSCIVPAGVRSFHASYGVDDEFKNPSHIEKNIPHIDVIVDGKAVMSKDLKDDQDAEALELDLTGKHSIGFRLFNGAGVGDPTFSKTPLEGQSQSQGRPQQSGPKPTLVGPKDDAIVSGDSIKLRWKPLEGATSYGVMVVSLKLAKGSAGSASRIWTATVPGETSQYALNLKDLPDGLYLWRVMGFGPKEPMGTFSADWYFNVEH